jgi:hypothetical protein
LHIDVVTCSFAILIFPFSLTETYLCKPGLMFPAPAWMNMVHNKTTDRL